MTCRSRFRRCSKRETRARAFIRHARHAPRSTIAQRRRSIDIDRSRPKYTSCATLSYSPQRQPRPALTPDPELDHVDKRRNGSCRKGESHRNAQLERAIRRFRSWDRIGKCRIERRVGKSRSDRSSSFTCTGLDEGELPETSILALILIVNSLFVIPVDRRTSYVKKTSA